jgi:hypothetical protein
MLGVLGVPSDLDCSEAQPVTARKRQWLFVLLIGNFAYIELCLELDGHVGWPPSLTRGTLWLMVTNRQQ